MFAYKKYKCMWAESNVCNKGKAYYFTNDVNFSFLLLKLKVRNIVYFQMSPNTSKDKWQPQTFTNKKYLQKIPLQRTRTKETPHINHCMKTKR